LSAQTIQPPRTLLIDLAGDEEQVLARMKQKTRYNIRLALKKGIVVRSSEDLDAFYSLMQVTGGRDSFGVHSLPYYRLAYELFHRRGNCELLMAEFKGEPLAGLMVFANGRRAWYFYGASANEHRERMPTYLLQWEAMRWARSLGCTLYDLWGVPDEDEETLEANFAKRSDGLWGVYRFKRGFGGQLRRAAGPWDRVYNPLLYTLYRWWTGVRSAPGEV
jgi:lipid II:glycine glycyltransferase (peptidoglycan interpeptide bridge formation enzyme)